MLIVKTGTYRQKISKKMNNKKKTPIKDKPLRQAGQSLDTALDTLLNDKTNAYIVSAIVVVVFALNEWLRSYNNPPPVPKLMTFIAALVVLIVFIKVKKILNQVKSLRLGRDGEREVGEYLDNLREDGHRIFHDILGDNFNLDHVIVSKKGIYVIETKTYSKPAKGIANIEFDGEQIMIPGKKPTKEPIIQVTAAAKWLRNILKESTGKEYPVKPVVVFPGWFVEAKEDGWKSAVWVLNPKALQTFINHESDKVNPADMMLATFHLSRYIRSKEE